MTPLDWALLIVGVLKQANETAQRLGELAKIAAAGDLTDEQMAEVEAVRRKYQGEFNNPDLDKPQPIAFTVNIDATPKDK